MSVFSEQRMLEAALPVRSGDSRRAKWWLNNESLIGAVKSCESIICENTESGVQCEAEILKEEENRKVRKSLSINQLQKYGNYILIHR